MHGSLTAKSESDLSVKVSDGHVFTCTYPAGTDLNAFPIGTQVRLHCHFLGGAFRLEYMKSETAVVEIKS